MEGDAPSFAIRLVGFEVDCSQRELPKQSAQGSRLTEKQFVLVNEICLSGFRTDML